MRAILVTAIVIAIGVPVISYFMLSTSWAQERIRSACSDALYHLLGTEAQIEKVDFRPFNALTVTGVSINDDNGNPALNIGNIELRLELLDLLKTQKLIIDYAVIEDLQASVYKSDSIGELNIAGILSRFKSKEKKDNSNLKLRINSIEIINAKLAYNVLDAEQTPGRFNPRHLLIDSLNADIHVPAIGSDDYEIYLKRLSLREQSGLSIDNLCFEAMLTPDSVALRDFELVLPASRLALGNIDIPLQSIDKIADVFTRIPVDLSILPGSKLYLPDLACFDPRLRDADYTVNISGALVGVLSDLAIHDMSIEDRAKSMALTVSGSIAGAPELSEMHFDDMRISCNANAQALRSLLSQTGQLNTPIIHNMLKYADNIGLDVEGSGSLSSGALQGSLDTECGMLDFECIYKNISNQHLDLDVDIVAEDLALGQILGQSQLGNLNTRAKVIVNKQGNRLGMNCDASIASLQFKDYQYSDIDLTAEMTDSLVHAVLSSKDPNLQMSLDAQAWVNSLGYYDVVANCDILKADLDKVNLYKAFPDHELSSSIFFKGEFQTDKMFASNLNIKDTQFVNAENKGLRIKSISIEADNTEGFGEIILNSDFINGDIQGQYDLLTVAPLCKDIFYQTFYYFGDYLDDDDVYLLSDKYADNTNDFTFEFEIKHAQEIMAFYNLPVMIVDPVNIMGQLSAPRRMMSISIDAPWLLQKGNKLIDNTYLMATLDADQGDAQLYLSTHMPTQKGPMNIIASTKGSANNFDTDIYWQIEREKPINGHIDFNTGIKRMADNDYMLTVNFDPGTINFGNAVWDIKPSQITYWQKRLVVDAFSLQAPTQSIKIDGTAGSEPSDVLNVDLEKIELLNIFETLGIDNAMICGEATGRITASQIMSSTPVLNCDKLQVKDIGYNSCVLGDADIKCAYDNGDERIYFAADVVNEHQRTSQLVGSIKPKGEEIDLNIYADNIRIGFLQHFMQAFCSGLQGTASGKAHLFGTFTDMDMSADIFAEELKLKIDFTNTWFTARNDSVHITPGLIKLNDITLYDDYGHTALLNGQLRHDYFRRPVFDFNVSKAEDFLCYDVPRSDDSFWYGRIFGNGTAHVSGRPGVVNIAANMTTAENSTFTFEISDAEQAEEYSFITFRDATPDSLRIADPASLIQSETLDILAQFAKQQEQDRPTAYNMDIQVDITPQAQVILVMDPVGGDRIKCNGTGQMHLTYGSANGDLALYGKYTLEKGDYNFTLQDIIVKEFKIKPGSSITFNGDPYSANLDINATYSVNANLSDLDESFLQDKELNRTNVPVNALMKVTGDMRQPDIDFDLEFPTLQQDIYRKVRSIVSTEEMMNRQIIYLLALHRFYTPDYMSTTKGNELFSVASSTISSQLSSMLGKLSDNWSIAPNLRSDRGDFSDIEVDVALSSSLLNNRLLFNGNFGYRDKSLNTNQFIGDFDIEYLLNRPGTIRLKAYNRYNDQNYYLRTAQTTQGVGISFRKDFDNLFHPFHKEQKEKAEPTE